MSRRHTVMPGECISTIAEQYGLAPAVIWSDAANAGLRTLRGDPNVLLSGDVVVIPEKRDASIRVSTGKRHVFRRVGIPPKLRLRLLREGKPRAGEAYTLDLGGDVRSGVVPDDGTIETFVRTSVQTATLTVGEGESADRYELSIGHLAPASTEAGVQQRLKSLGYYGGEVTGERDAATRRAIDEVREANGLPPDAADDAVRDLLKQLHGC